MVAELGETKTKCEGLTTKNTELEARATRLEEDSQLAEAVKGEL